MVVFSSTTFETGYVPDFPAQRKQIRSDLGPRVSFSQLMFRGIAIFHSLKSRIYTSEHSERRKRACFFKPRNKASLH